MDWGLLDLVRAGGAEGVNMPGPRFILWRRKMRKKRKGNA